MSKMPSVMVRSVIATLVLSVAMLFVPGVKPQAWLGLVAGSAIAYLMCMVSKSTVIALFGYIGVLMASCFPVGIGLLILLGAHAELQSLVPALDFIAAAMMCVAGIIGFGVTGGIYTVSTLTFEGNL